MSVERILTDDARSRRGYGWVFILGESHGELFDLIIGSLFALMFLAFVAWVASLLRDTLFPGAIRITPDGVEYRGRRMRFEEIEEVIGSLTIEFVGDRRVLTVPPTFCPPEAVPSLCRELERMSVEVGSAPRMT